MYYEPHTLVCVHTGRAIPLAMQRLDLSGKILPIGAVLRVTHKFRCEHSDPMEALYVSMLPRGAALRRFKIKGKGFSVESTLKKREKARKDYEKGVDKGHLSSLAEVSEDGLVTLAVGQVRPGETVTVVLEIVAGVDMSDRGLRFRYPFTIAQNYRSSARIVRDRREFQSVSSDLILPRWKSSGNLHQISFGLKVDGGLEVKSVSSPSHKIGVSSGKNPKVTLAGFGETPNRDLVLDVKYAKHGPVLFSDKVGEGPGPQWTAVLPTSLFPKPKNKTRKICFVIDNSGSMQGDPIEQAKRGLRACLSALGPKDRFGLISFNNRPTAMHHRLLKARRRARADAHGFIERIYATGGTELALALDEACDIVGKKGEIFLLTDGEVWKTDGIIKRVSREGIRVHVLGIGDASQDRFLAQLASETKGVSRTMGVQENVGKKALELFNAVRKPVLKKAKASFLGTKESLGRVWANHPVVLRNSGNTPTRLKVDASNLKEPVRVEFGEKVSVSEGVLGLLWAAKEIESLELKDTKRANKKLRDLGKTFGLASREMSLVAVVKRKGDKAREMVQEVVPVGTPVSHPGTPMSHVYCMPTLGSVQLASIGSVRRGGSRSFTKGLMPASASFAYQPTATRGMSTPSGGTSFSCSVQPESWAADSLGFDDQDPVKGIGFADSIEDFAPTETTLTVTGPIPTVSDSLLDKVGQLESDGGMPGDTPEARLLSTILLGLVALQEDPSLYAAHLERMAEFLEAQAKILPKRAQALQEMAAKFRQGSLVPGAWTLDTAPTEALWTEFRAAL